MKPQAERWFLGLKGISNQTSEKIDQEIDQEIERAAVAGMLNLRNAKRLALVMDGLDNGTFAQEDFVLQQHEAVFHIISTLWLYHPDQRVIELCVPPARLRLLSRSLDAGLHDNPPSFGKSYAWMMPVTFRVGAYNSSPLASFWIVPTEPATTQPLFLGDDRRTIHISATGAGVLITIFSLPA